MTVKPLKNNSPKVLFWTLKDNKLDFFKNGKSVSVMAGHPSSKCHQNKSSKRFFMLTIVLMTSLARVFITSKKSQIVFCNFGSFWNHISLS